MDVLWFGTGVASSFREELCFGDSADQQITTEAQRHGENAQPKI
jgi:hypothetical protein